ncbi:Hsp70 family protein [Lentzea sp. NPDC051213]|uniref:Hsp70 family protein n=1 Tax=Lentzea sp. NPDC051213 TaxID=3364126 RepID=UPI0037989BE0
MTTPWVLAVDFGTTNTVASVADATSMRTLTINGRPVMPSAVLLNRDGSWTVGDAAVRFARGQRGWFEPCPKYWVRDEMLFLGGKDVRVTDAITALLRPIVEEATRQHGDTAPAVFVVTHPATWLAERVGRLVAAARSATAQLSGWPDPLPVAEPVAAAQRVLDLDSVPAQARIVVLDLGGGTVDVSVVDRDGPRLTVVGRPTGIEDLGGEDFDLRLANWMTAEAGSPGLYTRLAESTDPDQNELANDIRGHARAVKEQLSRQTVVSAHLPKSPPDLPDGTPVQVTKATLEDLVRGGPGRDQGLTDAVDLVEAALADAPPGPPFAGVFLAGGGARFPLLGSLVSARTAKVPLDHGDPTTAVADGAAQFALTQISKQVSAVPEDRTKAKRIVAVAVLVAAALGGTTWYSLSKDSCDPNATAAQQQKKCEPPTSSPSSPTTTTTTTTTPSPSPTDLLIAHIPSALATGCTAFTAPDRINTGVVAAVRCTPHGSPTAVFVYEYSTPAAMNAAFDNWTALPKGSDCTSLGKVSGYRTSTTGPDAGRYACYPSATEGAAVAWTYDRLNIMAASVGGTLTMAQMEDWFLGSTNFR